MKNLLYFLIIAFVFTSCQKHIELNNQLATRDISKSPIEAFTALPAKSNVELQLIVENIKSAENKTPFIAEYSEKNGYPAWDNTISTISNVEEIKKINNSTSPNSNAPEKNNQKRGFFLIPLIDTSTREVKAYIACEKQNDSSYIYKTYNKKDILSTRNLDSTQAKNITPLLAMFAFMEQSINKRSENSFLGNREYKFKNIKVTPGKVKFTNKATDNVTKSKRNNQVYEKKKIINVLPDCYRELLGLYLITYGDGSFDILYIHSDCLTLPAVTVISSPRNGGGGGSSAGITSYSSLLNNTPGAELSLNPGNFGSTNYSGSPTGWVSNPWNIYWENELNNITENQQYVTEFPNPYFAQLNTITAILGLSQDQVNWLSQFENFSKTIDILNFLEQNEYDGESIFSALIAIEAGRSGFYESWQDAIIEAIFNAMLPPQLLPYKGIIKNYVKLQMAIEKELNPNANSITLFMGAFDDIFQLGLDIAGFTPVVGPIFDITSGTLYALDGNWSDAAISASAIFPIAGEIPAAARVIKSGRRIVAKILETGVYYFPQNNRALRKALNLIVGDSRIAHHIIPLGKQDHELLQRAAKAGFDMNTATNGIPLSTLQHNGNHQIYSNRVAARMTEKLQELGTNNSPQAAKAALESVITEIRNWISNHPHTNINNIQF